MAKSGEFCSCPQAKAVMFAKQAEDLAKEGKREESKKVFMKAFAEVRKLSGPLGNIKNDVAERSRLATVLADRAFSAGMGATFAIEMWRYGCNAKVLCDDDRGATHMFYPVELMGMAIAERDKFRAEEDAVPPAVCEAEKEERMPWPLDFLASAWRNLVFGEGRKRGKGVENE